ncbi:MAG: hypothetical protein FJ271_29060 [Planctomycetes bacterium]|nr:hypothetical protein [Planctomycetota bacterium]
MTLRCPVCRADNAAPATCRRCRADLSLLWSLEGRRHQLLAGCRAAVGAGRADEILRHAQEAHALRHDEDSRMYLTLGHLLERNFLDALRTLCTASNSQAPQAAPRVPRTEGPHDLSSPPAREW